MLERRLPSGRIPSESLPVNIRQYAVITDESGRVLVLQYPSFYKVGARNRWTLPGGGLLEKEDPRAGMFREVREETGLDPALGLHVRVHRPSHLAAGLWILYRGFAADTAVKLSREHADFAWVGGNELLALPFYHGKLRDVAVEMLVPNPAQWVPSAAMRSMMPTG